LKSSFVKLPSKKKKVYQKCVPLQILLTKKYFCNKKKIFVEKKKEKKSVNETFTGFSPI